MLKEKLKNIPAKHNFLQYTVVELKYNQHILTKYINVVIRKTS